MESSHDGQHFFVVSSVVLFCRVELLGIVSDWTAGLPSRAETKDCASPNVAGVGGDIDLVVSRILMVYNCEAFPR